MLTIVATAFAQLKDKAGVGQTLTAANDLGDEYEVKVLPTIATSFAQLDDWRIANRIINDEIYSNEVKARTLYQVLVVHHTHNDPKRQEELLKVAE